MSFWLQKVKLNKVKKKILFRADGNSKTGLGHLYRLFSLVESLKSEYSFIFLTKETSTRSVIPREYPTEFIPEDIKINDEPLWIIDKFAAKEHVVIADGYGFISLYQKKIKQLGFKLVYIDDLATEHMYADIVINHSPYFRLTDYKKESYTTLALGTKYAMLRPVFLNLAKKKREIQKIENVFVCFGGADPFDLSLKAVKALLINTSIKEIHLVLGAAYNHADIYNLLTKSKKLNIYKNLDEYKLSKIMSNCHLGIVPSSTILFELCSVKMPILSGYYVDNQKFIYSALNNDDVIFKGGDFSNYNVKDFVDKIDCVLNLKSYNYYLNKQQQLFDGHMKPRFLGLINQLSINFRKAKKSDAKLVFNWSNDSLVRKQSFNSEEIKWDQHLDWFINKVNDNKCLFLITIINDEPAGLIRFDIDSKFATIGILLSNNFRGQNLAVPILKKSSRKYFKDFNLPILAYIKKSNLASIKSFEKASYIYFKDVIVKGNSSFVYKLEKEDAGK